MFDTDFFSNAFVLRNLLIIFKGINFIEGSDYIKNLFIKGNENLLEMIRKGFIRYSFDPQLNDEISTLNKELLDKSIDDIYSGTEDKIYIPTEFYIEKIGGDYYGRIKYNNELFFNANDIIDNSLKNIDYQKQLTRIKFLMTL